MQIHDLPTGTIGSTEYAPIDNGTTNRKITLATLGNYVLNTLTLSLGGVTRTVKSAIDTIKSAVDTNTSNISTLSTKVGTGSISNVGADVSAAIGNTSLGTTATTLSGAIAEHEGDLSALGGLLISKSYSATGSIEANTGKTISGSDIGISTPSGYTPIGVVNWATGHTSVMCRGISATSTGSSTFAYLRNIVGSTVNYTFSVRVLYVKTGFYTAQ